MPIFDIIIVAILVISAGMGFYQGAIREMVAAVSFTLAAIGAVYGLRFTGPIAQGFIHPDWVGTVCALVVSFAVIFAGVKLLGSAVSQGIRDVPILGALDRSVGLGFGLLRAFIFFGAFNIAFTAATPDNLKPSWIANSKLYPLTETAGALMKVFAPKGLGAAGEITPALTRAVLDGSVNPQRDSDDRSGYDAHARGGIDDLVEKAR
jgi:membrane protein required for colicin V production